MSQFHLSQILIPCCREILSKSSIKSCSLPSSIKDFIAGEIFKFLPDKLINKLLLYMLESIWCNHNQLDISLIEKELSSIIYESLKTEYENEDEDEIEEAEAVLLDHEMHEIQGNLYNESRNEIDSKNNAPVGKEDNFYKVRHDFKLESHSNNNNNNSNYNDNNDQYSKIENNPTVAQIPISIANQKIVVNPEITCKIEKNESSFDTSQTQIQLSLPMAKTENSISHPSSKLNRLIDAIKSISNEDNIHNKNSENQNQNNNNNNQNLQGAYNK